MAGGRRGSPLAASHSPEAVAARLGRDPRRSYVRDLVYGAVDGTVTTFAVVAGAWGAGLSTRIVLVLGVANLVADGFSMGAANYLGVRSEEQRRRRTRDDELEHIAVVPEGEREEIRQIFAAKGFRADDLDRVVDVITENRERWVQTMLTEEHGFAPHPAVPLRNALATFSAFVVVGFVPIAPFAAVAVVGGELSRPFVLSAALTAAAFLVVGAARGLVAERAPWRTALGTFTVGATAASIAAVAGAVLGRFA
ncbi:MAG TPA: VIT1/CCC1 transporter family protein [Acidimicrobiia bacterium]|nr:VIT1/CCC1 transporter family protein [Acidimicrobiia bacterium]